MEMVWGVAELHIKTSNNNNTAQETDHHKSSPGFLKKFRNKVVFEQITSFLQRQFLSLCQVLSFLIQSPDP